MQHILHQFTAENIAHALPGCRKVKPGQWKACCPAHTDNTPSLSITERNGKALFKCWSGCDQRDIIAALQRQGLWPEKKARQSAKIHTLTDKREMRAFIGAHEYNLKHGIPTNTKHQRLYQQYQRLLCSPFSPGEVIEMDLYCRLYRSDVKAGKTPSPDDSKKFMAFNRALVNREVPYAY